MHYAGIDAHKNYLTIAIVDNQDELVCEEDRVPVGDGEPLVAALEGPRPMEAVVETCPFWPWIHDVIGEASEVGFHLAYASRLEAIAASKNKTDSVDAELLARMLSAGLVPEVYPKPPEQRGAVPAGPAPEDAGRGADLPLQPHPQPSASAGAAGEPGLTQGRDGPNLAPTGGVGLAEFRATGPGRGTPGAHRAAERADRGARQPDSGGGRRAAGDPTASDDPRHRALPQPAARG